MVHSVPLASHFPHHWLDLASYKLLILCTYRFCVLIVSFWGPPGANMIKPFGNMLRLQN